MKEAAGLDVMDLAYSYSSEKYGTHRRLSAAELPRRGLLFRLVSFWVHLLWAVLRPRGKRKPHPKSPVVFFATSLNQRESLIPVVRHVPSSLLVCPKLRPGAGLDCPEDYSLAGAYLWSLPFLPLVVGAFRRAGGYQRESFSFWLDEYWLSYGVYISARRWLRRTAPGAVVLSNDHTMLPRTVSRAARDEGIPTVYLQHGAGSIRNPPLAFDYALLDGKDSLGKFEAAGPSRTRVFLVGKARFDGRHREINKGERVDRIGICTNYLDPIPRVEELCGRLRRDFGGMEISIRPHPRDQRKIWREMATRYSMEYSDAMEVSPFEFLKGVDAIIAGDSSIHVEAALMNTVPLFFDFSREGGDSHDFQEAGLIEYVSEVEDICQEVRHLAERKPDVRSRAKPFVATVDTPWDGRSGELAATLIERFRTGEGVEALKAEGWSRIVGADLEAWELRGRSTGGDA